MPCYLKETEDFVNKINNIGNIPPNSYLVLLIVAY